MLKIGKRKPQSDIIPLATSQSGVFAGASILTMQGNVAIENLEAGMRIITRNGARVLKDVKKNQIKARLISVGPGTLGLNRPETVLRVAPDQELLIRDWRAQMLFSRDAVIMTASRLIDGKYVLADDEAEVVDTYELCFDDEEIFYADGVEIVSSTVKQPNTQLEAA